MCRSRQYSLTPVDLKAIVGAHDICQPDSTSTIHSVHSVRPHPDYAERTRQTDIALVRLAVPVRFDAHVRPICLPALTPLPPPSPQPPKRSKWKRSAPAAAADAGSGRRLYAGRVSLVASWLRGRLHANLSISDSSCLPRQVGLPVLEVAACVESAAPTQGCLGVIGAPSLLCAGDAGAGVMVPKRRRGRRRGRFVLIGVLSDRQYCETAAGVQRRRGADAEQRPAYGVAWEEVQSFHGLTLPMYTRVDGRHVRHWIERNTRDACECGR